MITEYGVDYGDLTGEQRFEIDQKAYSEYYMSCYENFDEVKNSTKIVSGLKLKHKGPLTYNSWYGTELHKKFVTPLVRQILRKSKLDKIKKAD